MKSIIVGLLLFSTTAYAGPFIAPNVSADGVTLQMRPSGELFCDHTASGAGGTVAIADGGTGATTAPAALVNLGASPLAGSSSLTTVGTLTSLAVSSDATINGVTVGQGSGNGTSNTATGYKALISNTTGSFNIANGYNALASSTTGSGNTANGYYALVNNTGNYNTATGWSAGGSITTGSNNTFIGNAAGSNGSQLVTATNSTAIGNGAYTTASNQVVIGNSAVTSTIIASDATIHGITVGRGSGSISSNTATGQSALVNNTSGYNNIANGFDALYNNSTGYNNTANGYDVLFSNTTGIDNTANGYEALYSNTTGFVNTAIGYQALFNNTTGTYNTAFGYQAGEFISGGSVALTAPSGSLFLGSGTEALADGDAGETVIGYGAIGHGSNTTTIGGPSTVKTYITGIVTTSGYTVASLPAGVLGARAFVTDAVSPTFLGTLTGGGSSFCPVVYNGTAWIAE